MYLVSYSLLAPTLEVVGLALVSTFKGFFSKLATYDDNCCSVAASESMKENVRGHIEAERMVLTNNNFMRIAYLSQMCDFPH